MDSALDRFARTRGTALVGAVSLRRQSRIQTWIGGALLGMSAVLGGATMLPHVAPEFAYAAVGPGIAGLTNLSLGLWFRRSTGTNEGVALSDEATALLRALVARAQVWQGGWRPQNAPLHGPHAWPAYRAPVAPPASAMDALERAAAASNRIVDALGDADDERSVRLRRAGDEGMAEALHEAATQTGDSAAIEGTVTRMEELASLVERSAQKSDGPSALRSNLEATLVELRAEDEARRELSG